MRARVLRSVDVGAGVDAAAAVEGAAEAEAAEEGEDAAIVAEAAGCGSALELTEVAATVEASSPSGSEEDAAFRLGMTRLWRLRERGTVM